MALPAYLQEALDRAPPVGDDIDPDEIAEVVQIAEDVRAGRVKMIPHAEIQETIAAMRPLTG
jgi:hypothetical protein